MDIKAIVLRVIADVGLPEGLTEVKEELKLRDELKYEDLELVELIMGLEEETKVNIPDEDAEKFVTVKDVIDYLTEKTKPAPKPEPPTPAEPAKPKPTTPEPVKPAQPKPTAKDVVTPEPVKPAEPVKPVEPKPAEPKPEPTPKPEPKKE